MTKNKYYSLFNQYNDIIKSKQFNNMYIDENELNKVKLEIQTILSKNKRLIDIELFHRNMTLYESEKLENMRHIIEIISQKIDKEEIISENEYKQSYIKITLSSVNGIPISILGAAFILCILIIVF
ncbi:MAG: hypothetical protein IJZ79_03135 [Bacilli bacterium]|nr:hypothetical protein [Bacilli bacterium]MBQ8218721.1 hypothetical protein [Bacilli bacterium]